MAGAGAAGRKLAQRRRLLAADLLREGAARVEAAARRRVHRAGHVASQMREARAPARIGMRDRGEQRARVGMPRIGEDRALRRHLHDLPQIHHGHPVGHVAHHRQVMRDEQVGQAEAALQVLQQVHHLRLDRDIERADRLVAHHQLRLHGQRARDADALALAAAELVRIALRMERREADQAQQFLHPRGTRGGIADAMDLHRLHDRRADAQPRVERGIGILEHHLHAAAQRAKFRLARDLDAVEADGAAGGLDQPQHQARGRGLAAAGFADERQRLAARDREGDAIHRAHYAAGAAEQPALHRVVLGKPFYLEQRGHAARSTACSTGARMQAAKCAGATSSSAGCARVQASIAKGQRGWNRQPFGSAKGGGTVPSIASSCSRSSSRRGIEPSRPSV
jgi:hypothetical protein